jgi:hypothetical protein
MASSSRTDGVKGVVDLQILRSANFAKPKFYQIPGFPAPVVYCPGACGPGVLAYMDSPHTAKNNVNTKSCRKSRTRAKSGPFAAGGV